MTDYIFKDLRRFKCSNCGSMMFEIYPTDQKEGDSVSTTWKDFVELPYCHECKPEERDPMLDYNIGVWHISNPPKDLGVLILEQKKDEISS